MTFTYFHNNEEFFFRTHFIETTNTDTHYSPFHFLLAESVPLRFLFFIIEIRKNRKKNYIQTQCEQMTREMGEKGTKRWIWENGWKKGREGEGEGDGNRGEEGEDGEGYGGGKDRELITNFREGIGERTVIWPPKRDLLFQDHIRHTNMVCLLLCFTMNT